MKTADASILIVPGFMNSGPDHWQSRWEAKLSTAARIEQEDWDRPVLHRWTSRVIEAVAASPRPVVLVAHSCGVPTVVHAAKALPEGKVRGAFLVAPISEESIGLFEGVVDPNFAPYPFDPLPFPSVLVGSRSDTYCAYEKAADYANAWGAMMIDAGESGHINSASGHGPWPEGLMSFAGFMARL
jgi:predicted alpha/beta hydrolase family esterase